CDPEVTPHLETPTSLAMYSSWAFHSWLAFLYLKQVDIVNFIEIEMDQKVLIKQGWSLQTLQTLFNWDFVPSFDLRDDREFNLTGYVFLSKLNEEYVSVAFRRLGTMPLSIQE
ncbi:MAG: hypothetical protein Q9214_003183, partial [Letrouitia sp. 1 TL-2023]